MGYMIGETDEFSTWGRCRTPIFKSYQAWTQGTHNLISSSAFTTQANTFFRCALGPLLESWIDGDGNTRTAFVGAFAFPGPPFPASPAFYVGPYDYDPDETYAPHHLDDVEIQGYWVGRNVQIDSNNYAMAYVALNGVNGSFQTITPASNVIAFDL